MDSQGPDNVILKDMCAWSMIYSQATGIMHHEKGWAKERFTSMTCSEARGEGNQHHRGKPDLSSTPLTLSVCHSLGTHTHKLHIHSPG